MSPRFQQVLNEIAQLTPEERLAQSATAKQPQLIEHLHQMQRLTETALSPKKSWQDLAGIAPNLLNGEDAQAWVNRLRDEWDEREQPLRGQ